MAKRSTPEEYFGESAPVRIVQAYPIDGYIPPPPAPSIDGNVIILGIVAICFFGLFGLLAFMAMKKG